MPRLPADIGTTQAVFGEGPVKARVVLVGEQPGDREDRQGHPFVGPAGRELDHALERAGLDRRDVYITNAVKHFKFEERGKRRIHQSPRKAEVDACLPWLRSELDVLSPDALVLLGATAAKALLGSGFRLTQHRGEALESDLAPLVTATIHPSAILRQRDDERATRSARRSRATCRWWRTGSAEPAVPQGPLLGEREQPPALGLRLPDEHADVDLAAHAAQHLQRRARVDVIGQRLARQHVDDPEAQGGRGSGGLGSRGARRGGNQSGSPLGFGGLSAFSSGTISAPVPLVSVSRIQTFPTYQMLAVSGGAPAPVEALPMPGQSRQIAASGCPRAVRWP